MDSTLPALCSVDEFLKNEFDFIVVGGGTAGLVVAARLTECPDVHVGVLEAGAANIGDPMIMMPAMYPKLIGDPKYDWKHNTTPQVAAKNKVRAWPRGRGLGGSSAINYQMYVRGQASDYDDWERLGNVGWGFKDLLPYFMKHEQLDEPVKYSTNANLALESTYDAKFHGNDGPIHTSFGTWRLPVEKEWIEASGALRHPLRAPADPWSGDHNGVYHSLTTVDRSSTVGTRSYSTTGYFLPNAHRPNLHVLTEALVTKLIVSSDGAVTGVQFLHKNQSHIVDIKKEVILAAGSIKSPQILELSGVGNPAILKAAGVHCLVENNLIGEHLQDHPAVAIGVELVDGELSLDMLQDGATVQKALQEYATEQSGPLANASCVMAFESYSNLSTEEEIRKLSETINSHAHNYKTEKYEETAKLIAKGLSNPKDGSIQVILLPASMNLTRTDDQTVMLLPPEEQLGKNGLTIAACVARPLSLGTCHITSSSPLDDPNIDPAYLTNAADVEVLSKGINLIQQMLSTSPFKEKIRRRYYPPASIDLDDDAVVAEYIRGHVATEYHPIGTVALGQATDLRLKVKGTKGLRVCDASVLPIHISGNPLATVYAIAEKAGDMIKEDWHL